jgi:hypothetical protein
MRRSWLGFSPAVFPKTSFIFQFLHLHGSAKPALKVASLRSLERWRSVAGRKLQEERCEQWVSDAGMVLSILLGDFASLIRLSITIRFAGKLPTSWKTTASL